MGVTSRRVIVAVTLISLAGLVGCGSESRSGGQRPGGEPADVSVARREVSADVSVGKARMAVTDAGATLLVDRSGGALISGARLVAADGTSTELAEPLPLLRNPWPVALDSGFAIGGLRCITEPTSDEGATDDELMCTDLGSNTIGQAQPYVVFLDERGTIEAEVAGPVGNPSGISFQGVSDTVYTRFGFEADGPTVGTPVPYSATKRGFEQISAPPGSSSFCELPDGSLLSAGPPEGARSTTDVRSIRVRRAGQGDWQVVSADLPDGMGQGLGCIPGGLIGTHGLFGHDLEWRTERTPLAARFATTDALAIVDPPEVLVLDHDTEDVLVVDWITGESDQALSGSAELAAVSPNRSKLAVLSNDEVRVIELSPPKGG